MNHEFKYNEILRHDPDRAGHEAVLHRGLLRRGAARRARSRRRRRWWRPTPSSRATPAKGARENAKKHNLKIVYDKTYPPATTGLHADRARDPGHQSRHRGDLLPIRSTRSAWSKAVNELNFKPKMIGGAMVGLQATVFKNQLGPLLNGFVNYETWVPRQEDDVRRHRGVLQEVPGRGRRPRASIRSATTCGGWGYAYIQVLGDAVQGRQQPQRRQARRLHPQDHVQDHPRPHQVRRQRRVGRRAAMLQVQYHGIKQGDGIDVYRGMSYQTVLTPADSQDRRRNLPLREGKIARPSESGARPGRAAASKS